MALALEPDNPRYLNELGKLYFNKKLYIEAGDNFINALKIMPDMSDQKIRARRKRVAESPITATAVIRHYIPQDHIRPGPTGFGSTQSGRAGKVAHRAIEGVLGGDGDRKGHVHGLGGWDRVPGKVVDAPGHTHVRTRAAGPIQNDDAGQGRSVPAIVRGLRA